jgi:protein CpxP
MKKQQMNQGMFRAAAVLLCAGGLMVSSAMAQQQDAPPPPQDGQQQGPPPMGPGGMGGRGMNPERRMEMLQKHLGLSTDQATQMRAIFEMERGKMEGVRANTSLAPQDRRAQMMEIHQDSDAKVHALLTADQKTKYDEMQARQRERMQEHRRGAADGQGAGDGSAPPPPSPQR